MCLNLAPVPPTMWRRYRRRLNVYFSALRTTQAVPAIQALVAGAVADGDVTADVAEGRVAHHLAELGVEDADRGAARRHHRQAAQIRRRAGRAVGVALAVARAVGVSADGDGRGGGDRRRRDGGRGGYA